ncbi:hypothetical protein H4218_005694 [Coemansia sp. IMI 209128]|nr:hypothetical protein H4218_005694 [Coemansia sp. IMI 209128]
MPRPTRKAAKPAVSDTTNTAATTKLVATHKNANAAETDELRVASSAGNRRLRSQAPPAIATTPPSKSLAAAADSGIEDDDATKESLSKHLAADVVGASPGKSPRVTTPRYGRRISSGVAGNSRRLTFDISGRRTSGGSDMVFDGLLDGFSPIKRNAPLEKLDFDNDEEEDLPQAEDVLAGRSSTKHRAASISEDEGEGDEEDLAADESDSELFDIDALVARSHRPKHAGSGVSPSLGDSSVADLLGKSSIGELLPRRTRTRSQAPKPEPTTPSSKSSRGRAATRKRKLVTSEDKSSSSEGEEDAGDSWKPSKVATPARKPKKVAATATTKRAASSHASAKAKPRDSEPAAPAAAAGAWSVDPKTAKYFDDIDGFELTEEAV